VFEAVIDVVGELVSLSETERDIEGEGVEEIVFDEVIDKDGVMDMDDEGQGRDIVGA